VLNLFEKGSVYKPRHIESLLLAFPGRRFWLVGDSGEHDPETYAQIWHDQNPIKTAENLQPEAAPAGQEPLPVHGSSGAPPAEARAARGRVDRILIREVPGADNSDARWTRVFAGIPDTCWMTFSAASELDALLGDAEIDAAGVDAQLDGWGRTLAPEPEEEEGHGNGGRAAALRQAQPTELGAETPVS
jgi:hypothetical protein